jgi:hypothetical protein
VIAANTYNVRIPPVDDRKSVQDQILRARGEHFGLTTDCSSTEIRAFGTVKSLGRKELYRPGERFQNSYGSFLRFILTLQYRLGSVCHSLTRGVMEQCALHNFFWLDLPSCKTRFAGSSNMIHFEPSPPRFCIAQLYSSRKCRGSLKFCNSR